MARKVDLVTKILTEDEVKILSDGLRQLFGPRLYAQMKAHGLDTRTTVRFIAVASRCQRAREARGLSIKEAAAELKVPQYRLKDIEQRSAKTVKAEILLRYIVFLGLSRWFSRWKKANPRLADQILRNVDNNNPPTTRKGKPRAKKRIGRPLMET